MEGSQIPTGAAALLPSCFAFLSVCMKPAPVLLGNTAGDPVQESNAQELSIVTLPSMGASLSGLLPRAPGTQSVVQLETEHGSQRSMGHPAHKVREQSFCFSAPNPEVQVRRVASRCPPASAPGPPAPDITAFCCRMVPLKPQRSCQLLRSSGLQVRSGH